MYRLLSIKRLAAVLGLSAVLTVAAPAFAHQDMADTTSTSTTTTTTETETETEHGVTAASKHPELHQRAAQILAERHDTKHSADAKQKFCVSHKQGLNTKFERITTAAQRTKTRIDDIFNKAQAYQQDKNLNPANYNSLVATANDAQASATAAISELQAVKPTVDCNSTSVASDVATFKAAAEKTRDSLKSYRQAVKAVLQALRAIKPTTEGSDQ
jgi:hypothetical protein